MSSSDRETFSLDHLIIPEGGADEEFLRQLVNAHGLSGRLQVIGHAMGKDGYTRRLEAIAASERIQGLKSVLIVTDSNGDPEVAFRRIVKQIEDVKDALYGLPPEQRTFVGARVSGLPALGVLTLPWSDRKGNLETLLLDVVGTRYPDRLEAVDDLLRRFQAAPDLTLTAMDKARMACMIAMTCAADTSASVSSMWRSANGYRALLSDPGFATLVAFLRSIAE